MSEKINPYIAGAPVVEPSLFFGREDVFTWVTRALLGKYVDHILVIHGQRRVGKTSVLKQLPRRLPSNYIQVFLDFQGRISTSLERFLWWMCREITKSLRTQEIILDAPDQDAFIQEPDYFESSFIPRLIQALGDKKLLLTFDEFDTLDSNTAREGLALPLLSILQRMMSQQKIAFIFSIGSSGRKLENMQASYTDFFKQALYKKISFLDEGDASALITSPVSGVLEYKTDAIQRIYQITSGHPYYIQLICHELFSTCQKVDRWVVYIHHVEDVLDQVIERGTANLKYIWDEATPLGKWILGLLANSDEGTNEEGLAAALNRERVRFAPSDLASELLRLREKDILTQDNHYVVRLMRLWMQRNRPIERVREELVEINPIANRLIEIGEEYQDQGEYILATENFNKALAVDPDNLRARGNLGFTALKQQLYDEAVKHFEKALALDEEDVLSRNGLCQANLALGSAALRKGDLEQAAVYYHHVLRLDNEHQEARQKLRILDEALANYTQAELALKHKEFSRAASLLKEVILVSESYKNASSLLAQAVTAQRNHRPTGISPKALFGLLGLMVVLLAAWLVATNLDSIRSLATNLPSISQIFASKPTESSELIPTAQPTPFPTEMRTTQPTPLPTWISEFAQPILKSLEGTQPTFADDFSQTNPIWGEIPQDVSIRDGVFKFTGMDCRFGAEILRGSDFVLDYSFTPKSDIDSVVGIEFKSAETDGFEFLITINNKYYSEEPSDWKITRNLEILNNGKTLFVQHGRINQLRLIRQGDQLAVYLNGKPLAYVEDLPAGWGWLQIAFSNPYEAGNVEFDLDNVKFWRLESDWANFVEPVLQSIASQPPDYAYDFSESEPGWEQAIEAGAQIADGALSYSGPEIEIPFGRQFLGRDFVLQYSFTPRTENRLQFFNMNFRAVNDAFYSFWLDYGDSAYENNNRWGMGKNFPNNQAESIPVELSIGGFDGMVIGQPNAITIIAQGEKIVILINGMLAGYALDDQIKGMVTSWHVGSSDRQSSVEVVIDDLKFWDLDPIEEKQFTKPILLAANTGTLPHTFGDDFEEIRPEWGQLPEGVSIADGMMILETDDGQGVSFSHQLFSAQDFYLKIQLTVDYQQGEEGISIRFRVTTAGDAYNLDLFPDTPLHEWAMYRSGELLLNGQAPGYLAGINNEMILLAQGDQFAVYINGDLLAIFNDGEYKGEEIQIVINRNPGVVKIFIDELNFIDLSQSQFP